MRVAGHPEARVRSYKHTGDIKYDRSSLDVDSTVNNKQSCEQRRLRYLLLFVKLFNCYNLVRYFSGCQSQERRHASAHVHTIRLTRTLDTAIRPTVLCQGTAAASEPMGFVTDARCQH